MNSLSQPMWTGFSGINSLQKFNSMVSGGAQDKKQQQQQQQQIQHMASSNKRLKRDFTELDSLDNETDLLFLSFIIIEIY